MPFKPGQSGNPGGRPKDSAWVKHLAAKRTEDAIKALADALEATRLVVSAKGDVVAEEPDHRVRVAAAQALLDRAHGKPAQAITGEDGGAVKVDTSAGLLETLKRLAGDK